MSCVRVLYLGAKPIGSRDATGQTLGSIYTGLPPESILQLVDNPGQHDQSNIVALPKTVAPVTGAIHWTLARLRASSLPAPGVAADGLNAAVRRDQIPVGGRLRREAKAASDLSPVRLPIDTIRAVSEFRPTVIHSLLGSCRMMRLALELSKRFDVPIVPHFMDNWMLSLYPNRELCGLAHTRSLQLLRRVLDRSPLCLTIGSAMASDFSSRMGIECVAIGNSVDPADYSQVGWPREVGTSESKKLVYVGGLHLGRADVLIQIAKVMRESSLSDWTLVAHTSATDAARYLDRDLPRNLKWGGEIDVDDVPRRLTEADALLFVESEDSNISDFTRLSVSTKVPQYLAANRPLLIVGPTGQASVEEFRTHGVRVRVAHSSEGSSLRQSVQGLSDWARPEVYSFEAPTLPEQYDVNFVRNRFIEALDCAVSKCSASSASGTGL
jgi:hypothetical protein